MALNLTKTVIEFLRQRPETRFTSRDIAEWIFENNRKVCEEKRKKSLKKNSSSNVESDNGLILQIAGEIGAHRAQIQKQCPQIKTSEDRPRRYYFTEMSDIDEVIEAEKTLVRPTGKKDSQKFPEEELYPKLREYLWSEFGLYSQRVDEKHSCNSKGAGGNHWLYPDVVAMEDLSSDWHPEIKACAAQYADIKTKLWSFEVKIFINRSNVRESFYQAALNSSWANFGYLVAAEVENTETTKELRMLSAQHGIGVIRLDADNPAESEIIIPAKEKNKIDWDATNRLAIENRDFMQFIKLVRQFYQTGNIKGSDWNIG